jgi:hypothetical protein
MKTTFQIPHQLASNPRQLINYIAVEIAERLLLYPAATDIKTIEEALQQFEVLIKQQASHNH